jgi:NADH dehydrogenase (ubiquinone) 1 alpha subcomplex subunit 9
MIARRPAAGLLAKTSVSLPQQARRGIQHDIAITRTGKPILRTAGGRSSLGGHTATVFGATGFLGRYIVNRLARAGCTVVIPYREEMAKRHLKVMGDLGRVVFTEYDLRNTDSIEESVRHSDMVFNLVGRDYPTKNFDLEDVHVEGTHRIASAVAKYDVDRFIHVSSHSVHPDSPSEFYKTKYYGEAIARDIFPETTIVRPAPMFGFEDRLLHRLAGATNVLTANHMAERFWPVHAIDVGEALEVIAYDDSTAGETFELYGPKQYSMKEISAMVDKEIMKTRRHINVPKPAIKALLGVLNKALWWPVGSADQVEREFHDQFIDKNAKTFKDLDLVPGDIANFTYAYLVSCSIFLFWRHILINSLTHFTAPLPQRIILRPPSHVGEGEARGEEVPSRSGRPIEEKIESFKAGKQFFSFVCAARVLRFFILFCSKAKFRSSQGLIARFAWCGWLYIYPSTNKYKEKKGKKKKDNVSCREEGC